MVRIEEPILDNIYQGDALDVLRRFPNDFVDCVVTSPPYWALRDYGANGQLGLERTVNAYLDRLCVIFDELRRVLKPTGTCWVNLGDTYGTQSGAMRDGKFGAKSSNNQQFVQPPAQHKCLMQIPSRFALEMCNRGWILRNEIIWHKPNCMPSPVRDKFTVDFEKLFFFAKQEKYCFEPQYEPLVSTHGSGNGFKRPPRLVAGGRGNDTPWSPNSRTKQEICLDCSH